MHTHTHLTIKHSASNGQLQCFRHPSTPTDGRCPTQTQPSPLTNAYSAMETHDVNRNNCNLLCVSPSVGVNVCFIHAWFKQECSEICLPHVDTNRQNSPKSIKRKINAETRIMINLEKKKTNQIYFFQKIICTFGNKFIHS